MAEKNPFRYRGYYFDAETGFYYLQTRYYDPSIRRFISADNYELIPQLSQTLGQLNMYAYCNNNPILFTDENGEGLLTTILVGIVVVLIAGLDGGISASLSGGDFGKGFLAGAAGGLVGYLVSLIPGLGSLGPYLGRLASSAIYDVANPLLQKGKIEKDDWINLGIDLVMDVALSSIYANNFSPTNADSFRVRMMNGAHLSMIDGYIDIVQTFSIYNTVSSFVNMPQKDNIEYLASGSSNSIEKYYIVGV